MVSKNRFSSASTYENQPISKTYQYKKVMKPMLERKRRARINRCLDELKELMVAVLQAEGENVNKLEKADILEMTVSHLHKLRKQHELISKSDSTYADRFRAGFSQCAAEVTSYLTTMSSAAVNNHSTTKLLEHLGSCVKTLEFSYGQPLEKKGQASQRFQIVASGSTKFIKKIQQSIQIIQSHSNETVSLWRPW